MLALLLLLALSGCAYTSIDIRVSADDIEIEYDQRNFGPGTQSGLGEVKVTRLNDANVLEEITLEQLTEQDQRESRTTWERFVDGLWGFTAGLIVGVE